MRFVSWKRADDMWLAQIDMLRLAPKLGNWLRQAHEKHERSEKNEKNQKNNTGQERHRHHTRSTTHGRHRRRRRSNGLRMVNRTTQRPTRTKPSTQRITELRIFCIHVY